MEKRLNWLRKLQLDNKDKKGSGVIRASDIGNRPTQLRVKFFNMKVPGIPKLCPFRATIVPVFFYFWDF
ncbi:unnamed protein product [Prunus armeniaca]|uniref:Uncharacterized protein n=1 Tax=Prunus armeniaca TaxID=36596 RepID=A0A6J5X613_PRUAR|nr:unnamed protein product [Prunus armeniaca]CAB4306378.1 unnamed protein product [Prunus armeniaca]